MQPSNLRKSIHENNPQSHQPIVRQSLGQAARLQRPPIKEPSASTGIDTGKHKKPLNQSQDARNSIIGRPSLLGRPSIISNNILNSSQAQLKDPRPIKDQNFQLQCKRKLLSFLTSNDYGFEILPKTLSSPTALDFQNIFKFLFGLIDDGYEYSKKFEDDVIFILKTLRYPFASEITKSILHSVGSSASWPILLAMLAWLVRTIEVKMC